jgi:hypothetical protein
MSPPKFPSRFRVLEGGAEPLRSCIETDADVPPAVQAKPIPREGLLERGRFVAHLVASSRLEASVELWDLAGQAVVVLVTNAGLAYVGFDAVTDQVEEAARREIDS